MSGASAVGSNNWARSQNCAIDEVDCQRRYRERKRKARLLAVPSLAPVGDGAAPDGSFGPAGKRLRDSVLDEYELSEHELAVLRQACR